MSSTDPVTTTSPGGYRLEGDVHCIDLRVREIRQLFDLRDPAPFRVRDLDPGAVDYLIEAAEETPPGATLKIDIHIADQDDAAITDDVLRSSFAAHFDHALAVQKLRIRNHLRQGRTAVIVGVTVLTACLLIAGTIDGTGSWTRVLREGLVIGGWVAIWRPVEHFLYDWWPILAHRRMLQRIRSAQIQLHWGAPKTRTFDAVTAPPTQ